MNQSKKASLASRLFLPSLIFASFATGTITIFTALFLHDLSKTFGVNVGVMGQAITFASVVSVIFALITGILSIRFGDGILLLIGMFAYSIAAVGCYFAWSFISILIFYSVNGVAQAMIGPMTNALVGYNVALDKRAVAIGRINAAGSLAFLIGAPIMGVLSGFGGWRIAVLMFIVPFSIVALPFAGVSIPLGKQSSRAGHESSAHGKGFIKILSNRSATGCLFGNSFRVAVATALLSYGTAFTMERFGLTISLASIVILLVALFATLGNLIERPIRKRGRKAATVVSVLFAGFFTISYAMARSFLVSVVLMFGAGLFDGLAASSSMSLTLEQMPDLRGTMMSLFAAFTGIGVVIGAGIGGLTLILYNYEVLGIILGSMGIIAAIIFRSLTVDPTSNFPRTNT
jgi:predicted MFS family arabinose efflux permease